MKITRAPVLSYKKTDVIIGDRVSEECNEQWAWFERRSSANKDAGMQARDVIIDV